MTFSSKIKQEISTTECTRAEYLSELSGIIRTSAYIKIYNIKVQTENKFVANRIFGLFKILYDINLNITLRKNYNFKKQQKKNTVNFTFLREKKTVFLIQKKHLACDS